MTAGQFSNMAHCITSKNALQKKGENRLINNARDNFVSFPMQMCQIFQTKMKRTNAWQSERTAFLGRKKYNPFPFNF